MYRDRLDRLIISGGVFMNNVEEFNDNLFFVFEKLLMDKELAEKFAECKTEDELYNFCLKIKGGYTKEEWEKFAEIIYKLTINKENDKILLDNDLEEIGGGSMTNNIGKKALSGTLAALTAATVLQVGSVGASAASSSPKPKTSVSQRSSSPRWKKIIRGVLIGAGVAAVAAALGYGVYRFIEHKKEKNNTPKIFNEQPNSPNSSIKNNKQPGDRFRRITENEAVRGMKNMGNSCYMNSVVQQMVSNSGLREIIMKDTAEEHRGQEKLFKAVKELVSYACDGRVGDKEQGNRIIELEKLAREAGIYNGTQRDATEFFRTVLLNLYPEQACAITNPIIIPENSGKPVPLSDMIKHGGKLDRDLAFAALADKIDVEKDYNDWVERCKKVVNKSGYCTMCEKSRGCTHYDVCKSANGDKEESYRYFYQSQLDKLSEEENYNFRKPLRVNSGTGDVAEGEVRMDAGNRICISIGRFWQDAKGVPCKNSNVIKVPEILEIDGKRYKFVGSVLHEGNSLQSGHYYSTTSSDGKRFEILNDSAAKRVEKSLALKSAGELGTMIFYQLI